MTAKRILALLAAAVVVMFVATSTLFLNVSADLGDSTASAATLGCTLDVTGGTTPVTLTAEQAKIARTIVNVGEQDGVPNTGWAIAIAAALQESTLTNMTGGDRDSAGVFQQRPSQGWGTYADVTDVEYASFAFFGGPNKPADDSDPGLLDIAGWQTMTLTQAAQAVQRSGYPDAYAQWETEAWGILSSLIGAQQCTTVTPITFPSGDLGTFLAGVQSKIGDWYEWGATGPDRFDCSGLIYWAWSNAGHPMSDRTAAAMWQDAVPVPAGQEQAGDLLFSEFGTRVAGPGHVAVVMTPGTAIEAQQTGTQIHEFTYTITGDKRIGRLSGAAFIGGFKA